MPLNLKEDVVITNISPTIEADEVGRIERMTNVEFRVRGKGPFSRQIPTATFNADTILSKIRALAEEIVKVLESGGN